MGLNPENFHDDMEDFENERKDQGRQNYQFKAALPLFGTYGISRNDVQCARNNATADSDFLCQLKAGTNFPEWYYASKDAVLKSAEHLLDADKVLRSPAFIIFLECAARSADTGAALVFTVPGHGRWVMHNRGALYRRRLLYLNIPSSDESTNDLHILKYNDFIRELTEQ